MVVNLRLLLNSHTQLFNSTTKTPSTGAVISDIDISFRRAVPENEAVDADNNEIQDMGISGLDITISGVSGDTDDDVAGNLVNKFSKWILE